MARIRSIKPEFWVSEQIAECSPSARLTFVGLWNFSDDKGVHPAKPKTLKAELYPMDDFSADDVADWIAELIGAGLVATFESGGEKYWHVTGWEKHQKIDRPSFKHPAPPASNSASTRRKIDEPSTTSHRAPPPGVDRNGEERRGVQSASSPKARHPTATESSQGSRLPNDWTLPNEYRDYCRQERPDLSPDTVAERFRDHWIAKAGRDGVKLDWLATWRNWVRSERSVGSNSSHHSDDVFAGAR
jgi:hypothetical protein